MAVSPSQILGSLDNGVVAINNLTSVLSGVLVSVGTTAVSWTPTFTFAVPGDLAVVYANRVGTYIQIGKLVIAEFQITTSTFTHTTASGAAMITGLPVAPTTSGAVFYGNVGLWGGITKAGYTQVSAQTSASGATTLNFVASGSGLTASGVAAADMPTGGTVSLRGTVVYFTA